ncbi:hypothetical protein I307_05211 [Cryptococcus deuterogattii 99/473]|uniref:Unplaced genomic scaffold supercont1.6, whole genome shotgun sequence n=1 Tax=Cryptococcus deuterogattii Ram5 TaxID=1296110 RepID=A0A0D0V3N2_9TREE|nr:hypothetical protein I313_03144 [Cryptococcus deuterogattii Ram5]KIY55458.1 hypothetical protein I307_05211 [Cryptococcus deuterogattii 99/473]
MGMMDGCSLDKGWVSDSVKLGARAMLSDSGWIKRPRHYSSPRTEYLLVQRHFQHFHHAVLLLPLPPRRCPLRHNVTR